MGADLVGLSWTVDSSADYDADALNDFLAATGDADLIAALEVHDSYVLECVVEDVEGELWDGVTDVEADPSMIANEIRRRVVLGAEALLSGGFRNEVAFGIPGTTLNLIFRGEMSWGESPFDQFDEAAFTLSLAEDNEQVAKALGVVCAGLPAIEKMAEYRV